MQTKSKAIPYVQGVIMSVIIGLQYIFLKDLIKVFNDEIFLLLSVRFIVALVPMLLFTKGFKIRALFDKDMMLLSVLQPILNLIFQTYATKLADVTIIAYVTALSPVTTLIAGRIFLKEKISPLGVFFIASAVGGSILAASNHITNTSTNFLGIAFITVSLILRSLYCVKSKKLSDKYSAAEITTSQIFFGAIGFTVLSFITSQYNSIDSVISSLRFWDYASLIYLSVLSLSVAYYLNNKILSQLSVTMSGILNNLTFISTLVSGAIVLSEPVGFLSVAGSAIVIVSVIGSARIRQKTSKE